MIRIRQTHHCPVLLRRALEHTRSAVIDLETTGLGRRDRIVAVGVLVGRDAHILVTDEHRDLSSLPHRVTASVVAEALAPLSTRPDLELVAHNAVFDVGMLERAGIAVHAQVRDTMKLLKLLDGDRGKEVDDEGTGTRSHRIDRRYDEALNYKLKDVARHELGTDDEVAKLIASVPHSKWSRCGVKPADRAWLFKCASLTGFRRDELSQLTVQSFRLAGVTPHIHLEAKHTKNGKEVHQPIPAAFAEELRGYLVGKKAGGPLWNIAGKKTARMIRMDLKEAGVPIEVAGRVVDFHALRTTFGTSCALKGVPLVLAMSLLRHSTPALTARVYTVAQLSDLSKEVEKLG